MPTKRTTIALVMVTAIVLTATARAETASESFSKAKESLAKGEFDAALESYAAAARADRDNKEYVQRYAMMRRIVDLRSRLDAETRAQQWGYMARALRAFYVNERIYPELLKLDQVIHNRTKSAESAAMLAETQLAMHQNADAVKTLSALESGEKTPMTQLLLGIALVHTGKAAEAEQIATKVELPKDAGPNVTYTAARLYAAVGDSGKAMALLKACFEATLPSQLDGLRSHAKTCPEFTAIVSNSEFAGIMKVKSKVPESKCSGGSGCAGCPMRGSCPKSQGKK